MAKKTTRPAVDSSERERFQALLAELQRETDRAAVLLATAWTETLLGDILHELLRPQAKTGLPDLLDTQQPLSTFSARTDVLYRLGVIDITFFWSLYYLRKLRNDFAHDINKPGDLSAPVHRKYLDGFLGPFRESSVFTTFYEEAKGARFDSHPAGAQFRNAASYVLGRLHAVCGWARKKETLADVRLFPERYPTKDSAG